MVAVLTSGDINAIYDEQILNPPQPEAKDTPVSRALRRWLPKRAAEPAKDKGASPQS